MESRMVCLDRLFQPSRDRTKNAAAITAATVYALRHRKPGIKIATAVYRESVIDEPAICRRSYTKSKEICSPPARNAR